MRRDPDCAEISSTDDGGKRARALTTGAEGETAGEIVRILRSAASALSLLDLTSSRRVRSQGVGSVCDVGVGRRPRAATLRDAASLIGCVG